MQEIWIFTNRGDLQPELEYLCSLFTSLYRAHFRVAFETSDVPEQVLVIGYVSPEDERLLPGQCRLRLIPDNRLWRACFQNEFDRTHIKLLGQIPDVKGSNLDSTLCTSDGQVRTDADLLASAFFTISRCEERGPSAYRDQHGRFRSSDSLLGSEGVSTPWINHYVASLAAWLNETYGVDLEPRRARPVAVISHDIDIPFHYGSFRSDMSEIFHGIRGRGKYKTARDLLGYVGFLAGVCGDPYNTYSYLMEVERKYGVRSTYFLLRDGSNAWGLDDCRYRKIVRALVESGHEISLHPGYDSYLDLDRITSEKESVEALSGLPVRGVRNHFLRFGVPESYRLTEKLGLFYDSTLGYAEQEGFRAGICTPFRPYDIEARRSLNIVEIPLVVMDGTLRDYRCLTPDEALVKIQQLIDIVQSFRGTIVFNWHNTFLVESNGQWRRVFEDTLAQLARSGFEFLTCGELAAQYMKLWE